MIAPIEKKDTLADQAYEQLRGALMSGTFRPGETVSIRRLANLLDVSVTPARDAIARVLWERGLDSGPNRTVVVPELSLQDLREIYSVRLSLEGLAAAAAVRNIDDKNLKRLAAANTMHKTAVANGDYAGALKANESFHFGIYELSGNSTLIEFIRSLWLKLGPSLNLLYPAYFENLKGVGHHARIMEALEQRDPVAARSALEADLYDGQEELVRALGLRADHQNSA